MKKLALAIGGSFHGQWLPLQDGKLLKYGGGPRYRKEIWWWGKQPGLFMQNVYVEGTLSNDEASAELRRFLNQ